MPVQSADAPVAERGPVVDFTYFFCAAWGPPLGHPGPQTPRYPGGGTPRGTPPSTRAPAARGDKVVRFRHHRASEAETQTWACRSQRPQGGAANLAATLRGRTASIRRGSRTMQSFGSGRLDNLLHLPHNAHTHAHVAHAHVPAGGGSLWLQWLQEGSPKKRASAVCSVSESSPLQGGPWQGTCPPCAQGSKIWGCWGLLGSKRLPFHGSRRKQGTEGRGAETRQRRAGGEFGGIVLGVCVCAL